MTKIGQTPLVRFWNIYEPPSQGRISMHYLEPFYICQLEKTHMGLST